MCNWLDSVPPLVLIISSVALMVLAFHVGRASKEYPPEFKMIELIREARLKRKIEEEVNKSVDRDLAV